MFFCCKGGGDGGPAYLCKLRHPESCAVDFVH